MRKLVKEGELKLFGHYICNNKLVHIIKETPHSSNGLAYFKPYFYYKDKDDNIYGFQIFKNKEAYCNLNINKYNKICWVYHLTEKDKKKYWPVIINGKN